MENTFEEEKAQNEREIELFLAEEKYAKEDNNIAGGSLVPNDNSVSIEKLSDAKNGNQRNDNGAIPNEQGYRKRHRRGSKKNKPRKPRQKFKPYNKLTLQEKRKLDELDAIRAVRKREKLALHKGRPIAPYNTTQFLMEEHDPGDNSFASSNTVEQNETQGTSSSSSDEYYEKDFNEFYDNIHIDTLNSYSKEDLIKNVYELERKIEMLEKNSRDINGLLEENKELSKENEELKLKLNVT